MKLSRYKRSSTFSYAFGATLIFELLKTYRNNITRVFLRPTQKRGEDLKKLLSKLHHYNIDIVESAKAFNILGAKDSCLAIAEFNKPTTALVSTPETPHIVLVNPSDSGNLGTIIRTAVALGFSNLAIITPAVDHFDPKTIRASMGAIFHINIATFASFEEYLQSCNGSQPRTLYAFMLDQQSQLLTEIKPTDRNYALIFGNEATGLPESFANYAQPVFIPQSPIIDSLNLAVAASIGMYHFSTVSTAR